MVDTISSPWTRRGFLSAAGAAAGFLVSGCGTGGPSGSDADSGSGAGFPVTVQGKPKPVTVPSKPRRVVAVGFERDTDVAVALGAPLVGVVKNVSFRSGIAPWQKLPRGTKLITRSQRLPYEKIAALRPDLILAADDYSIDDEFDTLSKIAPTVGYEKKVGSDDWRTMATRIGSALGQADEAKALIRRTEQSVKDAVAAHPALRGRTFTFGPVDSAGINTISRTSDSSVPFFAEFGMRLAPQVTKLPEEGTPGRSIVSRERLDLLDADVVILTFDTDDTRRQLESMPLFQRLPAVRRGSYVALDLAAALAIGFPSVAAIPYALEHVLTPLSKAAAAVAG